VDPGRGPGVAGAAQLQRHCQRAHGRAVSGTERLSSCLPSRSLMGPSSVMLSRPAPKRADLFVLDQLAPTADAQLRSGSGQAHAHGRVADARERTPSPSSAVQGRDRHGRARWRQHGRSEARRPDELRETGHDAGVSPGRNGLYAARSPRWWRPGALSCAPHPPFGRPQGRGGTASEQNRRSQRA
jgi:hypothetical protein